MAARSTVWSMSGDQQRENSEGLLAISIGTALWTVAGVVLVLARNALPASGQWWIATCGVGVVSGLGGVLFLRRRSRQITAAQR